MFQLIWSSILSLIFMRHLSEGLPFNGPSKKTSRAIMKYPHDRNDNDAYHSKKTAKQYFSSKEPIQQHKPESVTISRSEFDNTEYISNDYVDFGAIIGQKGAFSWHAHYSVE